MRRDNKFVIWPVYFDSTKTRLEGRRVPEKVAVPSPKLVEVQRAVEKLGFQHKVSPEGRHPRAPWQKTGAITITKKMGKTRVIRDIVQEIIVLRKT